MKSTCILQITIAFCKLDGLENIQNRGFPSSRRKPVSISFNRLWTPAFAGMTGFGTHYDAIDFKPLTMQEDNQADFI